MIREHKLREKKVCTSTYIFILCSIHVFWEQKDMPNEDRLSKWFIYMFQWVLAQCKRSTHDSTYVRLVYLNSSFTKMLGCRQRNCVYHTGNVHFLIMTEPKTAKKQKLWSVCQQFWFRCTRPYLNISKIWIWKRLKNLSGWI